jgi:hypothetical protein
VRPDTLLAVRCSGSIEVRCALTENSHSGRMLPIEYPMLCKWMPAGRCMCMSTSRPTVFISRYNFGQFADYYVIVDLLQKSLRMSSCLGVLRSHFLLSSRRSMLRSVSISSTLIRPFFTATKSTQIQQLLLRGMGLLRQLWKLLPNKRCAMLLVS